MKNVSAPYPRSPAKWISNIPPWAHTSDAPTILGVGVRSILFPLKNIGPTHFFFLFFQVNLKDILTKKGPETIDF